ncbi:MAG: sugar phosphate isomerase/epimerase family protein [Eubacteriales bacterium]|nr:sugar phosphate isomerase/epimerase family protein [Eubacteriales bacterium]
MKLSFSTLGCPSWDLKEIFTTAKDLGYNGVEIRGVARELYAPTMKAFTTDKEKTLSEIKRLGIEISMLTSAATLAMHDGKDESIAEAKAYIDLARDLKVPFVRVLSTDTPYFDGGDIDLCKKNLATVAEYAEGKNVTVLMETNGLMVDTKKLAKVLDEVGGAVGALWDVHHPYRFGDEYIGQTLDNLGDRIKYVHLKDSVIAGCAPKYKMMGYGDIPLDEAIGSLLAKGYDGYFTLEWVKRWNKDLEEPGIVFAQYINYMKRFQK